MRRRKFLRAGIGTQFCKVSTKNIQHRYICAYVSYKVLESMFYLHIFDINKNVSIHQHEFMKNDPLLRTWRVFSTHLMVFTSS